MYYSYLREKESAESCLRISNRADYYWIQSGGPQIPDLYPAKGKCVRIMHLLLDKKVSGNNKVFNNKIPLPSCSEVD